MKTFRILMVCLCAGMLFSLTACQEKGTAEKAGAKIDSAVEKARKSAGELGDKLSQEAEQAEKAMHD